MEIQPDGRGDLGRVFGTLPLRQDEQTRMPEPVKEQHGRRDYDEDTREQAEPLKLCCEVRIASISSGGNSTRCAKSTDFWATR